MCSWQACGAVGQRGGSCLCPRMHDVCAHGPRVPCAAPVLLVVDKRPIHGGSPCLGALCRQGHHYIAPWSVPCNASHLLVRVCRDRALTPSAHPRACPPLLFLSGVCGQGQDRHLQRHSVGHLREHDRGGQAAREREAVQVRAAGVYTHLLCISGLVGHMVGVDDKLPERDKLPRRGRRGL